MAASASDVPPAVRDRLQPDRDPTRTVTLRRKFRQAANQRWRTVRGDLRQTLERNDALGLTDRAGPARSLDEIAGARSANPLQPSTLTPASAGTAQREAAVADWFRGVLDARVDTVGSAADARTGAGWWEPYVRQAYVRGLGLATADAKAVGLIDGDDSQYDPTDAISSDRHQNALATEYVQTYNDVEGAADAAHTDVTREAGAALAAGVGVAALTGRLTTRVDAVGQTRTTLIANTRVVDTVNRAIFEHAESLGAREVGMVPEAGERRTAEYKDEREAVWSTAGDARVCPQCAFHEGWRATLEEIKKGNVERPPLHPNCRCRFVVLG